MSGALVALPALERAREAQNVRALAARVGCDGDTARDLYRLSRREGYGAAFQQLFPSRANARMATIDQGIRST